MKKITIIICVVFWASLTTAQSWITSGRTITSETVFELTSLIDDNGNVLTFGYFTGTLTAPNGTTLSSYGDRDYYIIKYDVNGEFAWMRNFGSVEKDFNTGDMDFDSGGNIYITGGFTGHLRYSETDSLESFGSYDIFFIKLNENGSTEWARNAGKGATLQYATALKVTEAGNILLAGGFFTSINIYDDQILLTDNTVPDGYYAEFNVAGDLNWVKQIKTIYKPPVYLWSIVTTAENYYFGGAFVDSIGFDNDTIVASKEESNVFILKTDLTGTIEWKRLIEGNKKDFSFAMIGDDDNNIYLAGYSTSDTISFETSNEQIVEEIGNNGSFDLFVAKYQASGELSWNKKIGGKGDDRVFAVEYFDDKVYLSGRFADTLFWGGIELNSNGSSDFDMFTGALDPAGNFRDANSFSGRGNSKEESRGVFQNGDKLYNVMISNSDLLVIGDSIYTSDGLTDYIVLGVIGCNPISIDQVIAQDVQTCNGDSTGSIQILASGGFGAPWQYSIDNGLNYEPLAYFADLPAGDYPIVVIDAENCAQPGPTETVTQPDTLALELVSEEFTGDSMVNIVVAAYGGTPPYTYTLQPNGIVQGFGDFSVKWSEPGYYIVEVNDISNCGPVVTDTLTTSSGIDLFAPGVKMYPNPTSGIITVEVPFQGTVCTLEVLNLTGQVMLSRQVYSNGISINETIDLSDLSKGMYMIRVDGQTLKSGVVVN